MTFFVNYLSKLKHYAHFKYEASDNVEGNRHNNFGASNIIDS